LKLYLALGIAPGDVVAFVGAGGKSSAILAVADELAEAGITFLTAPTTKMLVSEPRGSARSSPPRTRASCGRRPRAPSPTEPWG
jgi:hypothetical protein